jgi:hypothetical protein
MAEDTRRLQGIGPVYRFVRVEESEPASGGQWLAFPPDGLPDPVSLNDVVLAWRSGAADEDPLPMHVEAVSGVVVAAGELEDRLFPDVTRRVERALTRAGAGVAEIEATSPQGEQVRQAAEALEKLAADLAELVEEQLGVGGSLATLPPDTTKALCQAVQTAWRLRRLIDPPGPLYL